MVAGSDIRFPHNTVGKTTKLKQRALKIKLLQCDHKQLITKKGSIQQQQEQAKVSVNNACTSFGYPGSGVCRGSGVSRWGQKTILYNSVVELLYWTVIVRQWLTCVVLECAQNIHLLQRRDKFQTRWQGLSSSQSPLLSGVREEEILPPKINSPKLNKEKTIIAFHVIKIFNASYAMENK